MDDLGSDDYHDVVRRSLRIALLVLAVVAIAAIGYRAFFRPFPSDKTPQGAYLRVALAISKDRERDVFPYLETEAQWSAYSIKDARKEAMTLALAHYPKDEAQALIAPFREEAEAADGSDVFAIMSRRKGFAARLRADLSGVASVETDGDRASVVTARGTRYPFHRRENGIWGLTVFTAELAKERERAARDLEVVRAAARDYARAAQ